jgi:hypothetical protein
LLDEIVSLLDPNSSLIAIAEIRKSPKWGLFLDILARWLVGFSVSEDARSRLAVARIVKHWKSHKALPEVVAALVPSLKADARARIRSEISSL